MRTSLLAITGVGKSYGEVPANHAVDLKLYPGEIHALLGENGAGKSTLVNILSGIVRPDVGTIYWQGEEVDIANPATARALGIGVVFQHFSIFQALTVGDNIALGLADMPREQLDAEIATVATTYGLAIDATRPMHTLSVGEWQRVEIVRCLLSKPKLLILDEPTSVLTPSEAEALFTVLRKVAAQGCAVLYISHRLREIRELCDRVTIMRGGTVITECDPQAEDATSLATKMIGTPPKPPVRRQTSRDRSICFSMQNLDLPRTTAFGTALADINLAIPKSSITAIAGVAGNGQQELAAVISGEVKVDAKQVMLNGKAIGQLRPAARRKQGLHFIPEERLGHAAVGTLSMWENSCLTARHQPGMMSHGFLHKRRAQQFSREVLQRFGVKCSGSSAVAATLSGGNLQKFILGRELSQTPQLLVIMQPTWGIDAAAAALIHQTLLDLAANGTAVLIISQDLNEVFALADQVAVINHGHLSDLIPVDQLDTARLGLLMGGIDEQECVAA